MLPINDRIKNTSTQNQTWKKMRISRLVKLNVRRCKLPFDLLVLLNDYGVGIFN